MAPKANAGCFTAGQTADSKRAAFLWLLLLRPI
jgi:hypothetical protein